MYSESRRNLSADALKITALITMLIDHLAVIVLPAFLQSALREEAYEYVYWTMRTIGRMAFPVYCFLLVESFKYTRNRLKYAVRLLLFAIVSEIPFDIAFNDCYFEIQHNNVFFTLLLGLIAIAMLEGIKEAVYIDRIPPARWLAMAASAFAMMLTAEVLLHTDYGAAGVACIVVMYMLREDRTVSYTAGVVILAMLAGSIELWALLMLPAVYMYSGRRGKQKKFLFYIFYPAHLIVLEALYQICVAM